MGKGKGTALDRWDIFKAIYSGLGAIVEAAMANEVEDKMELAFLEILRGYENQWVAIHEAPDMEIVVGSGRTAVEAKRVAEEKGFNEAALFKV